MNKKERLKVIEKIIEEQPVNKQEDLMRLLNERGIEVTQATVSRDIRELRLGKVLDSQGNYRYSLTSQNADPTVNQKLSNIFRDSVLSIIPCGNLIVVKCHSGTGNAAAAYLDSLDIESIAGTVAGDDTIFIAIKDDNTDKVTSYLMEIIS